jgi:hypothetical protein
MQDRRAFGISLGAALAQGTYNFDATITDIAGNTSGASSNYTVTIDTGTGTTSPRQGGAALPPKTAPRPMEFDERRHISCWRNISYLLNQFEIKISVDHK